MKKEANDKNLEMSSYSPTQKEFEKFCFVARMQKLWEVVYDTSKTRNDSTHSIFLH